MIMKEYIHTPIKYTVILSLNFHYGELRLEMLWPITSVFRSIYTETKVK